MMNAFLIFLGAGLGGVCRYWVSTSIYWILGRQFPYGTLVVNLTGSFLMGFLFVLILDRVDSMGLQLRALLLIGFLGGYTTFSSFSIETFNLLEAGEWVSAGLNVTGNVVLCILFTWIGVIGGRSL